MVFFSFGAKGVGCAAASWALESVEKTFRPARVCGDPWGDGISLRGAPMDSIFGDVGIGMEATGERSIRERGATAACRIIARSHAVIAAERLNFVDVRRRSDSSDRKWGRSCCAAGSPLRAMIGPKICATAPIHEIGALRMGVDAGPSMPTFEG